MARPEQEAVETFMSITGSSEDVAVQKLEEHLGDLNEAVNAHFSEGDRNFINSASTAAPEDDVMEIDEPIHVASRRSPFSLLSAARNMSPFSILDPDFSRRLFASGPAFTNLEPFVSHPREVREIPIEVKDGHEHSGHSGRTPTIEDVTGTAHEHGPEIHGTVTIDDEDDDEDNPAASSVHAPGMRERKDGVSGTSSLRSFPTPSAPGIGDLPDYSNDIEEEMIRAAIEASKRDVEKVYPGQPFDSENYSVGPQAKQSQFHVEDAELAHAVSLSLKRAEDEKALRELREKVAASELEAHKTDEMGGQGELAPSNGRQSRLEVGSSSFQDEAEEAEEQLLVRHRSGRKSHASVDSAKEIGEVEVSKPSSPGQHSGSGPAQNGNGFHSDEWGGISSEEHDEAIMLEAALFGGIPEGSSYHLPYAHRQLMQNGLGRTPGPYPRRIPRPPSPGLAAQRLIREQQDDEYLASLQADREKELKAIGEAEAWRLEEQAVKQAAIEEEKRKEEELRKKLEEEQEIGRQLAAKEASLPREPTADDENAVTLLVRMPDGSRRGRRFLKSDKLQFLFDFIDVGRVVKPSSYRLVRPYPRRAFSDRESALTLNELGLTSKQEALFLELI